MADRLIKILHLEDNALDAELTQEMLQASGLNCEIQRVYRTEDFRSLLQKYLEQEDFDLILADYNMPGFDGFTALKMTRQVDSDVPFILLSGALGEELAVELLRTGATDYVLKNNMQRLPLVVRRAIDECEVRRREKQSQRELRRARDEAQKANSAKSRFLGRISHELRTPLNAIIGYTQLMQADPMSEEQQHCTDQILKAGEHLLHLINEVLDITRIESGVIPITIKPASIATIIHRSADLVRPMARDNKISISIDAGTCDVKVLVDQDRLTQVLLNLITNAVKYNRPGGSVFVECQDDGPGMVKVGVRDTGIGIPEEKIDRLFTPFDRLDLEKDSSIQGTGLGLTVSKAIMEAMGGTLGVETYKEGSMFWIEMPAYEADQETPMPGSSPALRAVQTFSGQCNILLIEDHEPTADFLHRALTRRGKFCVKVARCGREAMDAVSNTRFDVAIVDLNLPDKSGEDLMKEMRQVPELSNMTFIVVTADVSPAREQEVVELGTYAYFTKPLNIGLLVDQITRVMQERCETT